MKLFKKSTLVALGLGALLFGCRPDGVSPTTGDDKSASLGGAFDDTHVTLDTVCKYSDSVFFRSSDGSYVVNKCVGAGGIAIPCTTPQMKWGHFVMYNGYEYTATDSIHWLDIDFALASGFVCDFNNWLFTTSNSLQVDPNTGVPSVGTDWSSSVINPSRNEWKVAILVNDLPQPCFDIACRMSVVRLRINGSPNENFRTTLWAINQNWNNPASEAASNNEFAIHYCPFGCLEQVTPPSLDSNCVNVQGGISELSTCTTLDADTAGAGITYLWSTGATTQSINVCPTATTDYTVTVSNGTKIFAIRKFHVNYENVRCGNTNGNNPNHKVWVCHIPPGNPNNPQDICIDWSGVPAHVAQYRLPGFNVRQGHDSGCQIGHCGSNPCE
jgi:hypothetical protein